MNKKIRWSLYYVLAFFFKTFVIAIEAHMVAPERFALGMYTFFLTSIISFVILLPFFILTWRGLNQPQRYIQRAIGSGFLVWILLVSILPLITEIGIFSHAGLLVYLLNITIGIFLIWFYRFSNSFVVLPFILPWISTLYFLIYGQIQEKDKDAVPISTTF